MILLTFSTKREKEKVIVRGKDRFLVGFRLPTVFTKYNVCRSKDESRLDRS